MNIWKELKKPILALAPMEDVTDTVFRRLVARCSRPDVFFTEFTSCDGLWSKGRDVVSQRLEFSSEERPIIAQIWGNNPDLFYKTAQRLAGLGFDGIDINVGCPDRAVMKHHCGASLIGDTQRVQEIIDATRKGAGGLPISIKTRIGINSIVTDEWIPMLLSCEIDALTIHGRTAKEGSQVPAHWDEIGKAVTMRDSMHKETVIIGNGDVVSLKEAYEKVTLFHVDGVMVGRGIFENPWLFDVRETNHTFRQRLTLMKWHISEFERVWGSAKHFATLKKYFKIYIRDIAGATTIRDEFMHVSTYKEALALIDRLEARQEPESHIG